MELRSLFASIALPIVACAVNPSITFAQAAYPPPPQPVIDPRPGPMLVWFQPNSTELPDDQREIIRRASNWGHQEPASLLLCYDEQVDATGRRRLQAVARALREAGAPRVVTDYDGWLCDHLKPFGELFSPPQEFPTGVILIYGLWDLR